MRLTRLTDYALRVLIHLALNPDRLCTIAEVAARYDISETHLMKITHQLGRAGWVATVRGHGGGMALALPPQEIRLGQVALTMEPDFDIVECFSTGSTCMLTGACKLTGVIEGALHSFVEFMDRHTLADILPTQPDGQAARVIRVQRRGAEAAAP